MFRNYRFTKKNIPLKKYHMLEDIFMERKEFEELFKNEIRFISYDIIVSDTYWTVGYEPGDITTPFEENYEELFDLCADILDIKIIYEEFEYESDDNYSFY